jgi:hypothetical protein
VGLSLEVRLLEMVVDQCTASDARGKTEFVV